MPCNPWVGVERRRNIWRRGREYMEERRGKGGGRDARRGGAGYVATRLEEEEEELDGCIH